MVIAVARRLPQADAFVRAGNWTADNFNGVGLGMDVSHRTLGIIGFGRVGQAIARRASGFEMPVLYSNTRSVARELAAGLRAERTELDRLLAESDFVVVQVPYGPSTHHLIGGPELARMKATAVLVHAGRGGVVDDAALATALKAGTIAGAAVDCFENEPTIHPALMGCPNVLLTPHIGSATPETRMNMVRMALVNLVAGLKGGTPPNVVDG
jgi:gluconate 2-dehydrogenase